MSPELRDYLKIVFLGLLNASSRKAAIALANRELNTHNAWKEMLESRSLKAKDLIQLFEDVHNPISKHFYTGIGLKLMTTESQIALSVIDVFAKAEIPILAIHDSFIVQSIYRDRLMIKMQKEYEKKTGFNIKVK